MRDKGSSSGALVVSCGIRAQMIALVAPNGHRDGDAMEIHLLSEKCPVHWQPA